MPRPSLRTTAVNASTQVCIAAVLGMTGCPSPVDHGADPGADSAQQDTGCGNSAIAWYRDQDEDGFGLASDRLESCDPPEGYVAESGDCDDEDPEISPSAEERCDDQGTDEDCDGSVNPGCLWGEVDISTTSATWRAPSADSSFSAGIVTDSDGDGLDDLVLSAATWSGPAGDDSGAVWMVPATQAWQGGTADAAPFIVYGEAEGDQLGNPRAVGDVTGDGEADLLLLARYHGASGTNYAGAAYLVQDPLQAGTLDAGDADWRVVADSLISFGTDGGVAGMFNDDGYADVLVSAEHTGTNTGSVYVFAGPLNESNMDTDQALLRLSGEAAQDNAGNRVLREPVDLFGDGLHEIVLSARVNDAGGISDSGATYIVSGPLSGVVNLSEADRKLTGVGESDWAGYSLRSAGDADEDGFDDLIIGAPGNDCGGMVDNGATYLVTGAAVQESTFGAHVEDVATWTLCGSEDEAGTYAGSDAADFDGDGTQDLGVREAGILRLFFDLGSRSGRTFADEAQADLFDPDGLVISGSAGDLDAGPGADLAVRVRNAEATDSVAYLVPGVP